MKSSIRILSVVFLTAIYCFAIGVVTKSITHADFRNNPGSSQEKIGSYSSIKIFFHTSQSESSVNNFNNLPVPGFQNPFTGLASFIEASEQLFEAAFSQYTTLSGNILIKNRKSDIIFPFHYFW